MAPEIDHIQYGRLLASVEHLTKQLATTGEQLMKVEARLGEIEGRFRLGKGVLIGITFATGYAAYAVKELVFGVFGK